MPRKANSIDNGVCENWFNFFKQETIYCLSRILLNQENIYKIVANYIEFFNFIRPMKKLKKMSPIEYWLAHF